MTMLRTDDAGQRFFTYGSCNGYTYSVCLVCAALLVETEGHEHSEVPDHEGLTALANHMMDEDVDRILGWTD